MRNARNLFFGVEQKRAGDFGGGERVKVINQLSSSSSEFLRESFARIKKLSQAIIMMLHYALKSPIIALPNSLFLIGKWGENFLIALVFFVFGLKKSLDYRSR